MMHNDTHPALRGGAVDFMRNIQASDLGLAKENLGRRIIEAIKRIFAIQRFTVVYNSFTDRRCARSCINEVVGWTPFKKIEYINLNAIDDYLTTHSLHGKRVLVVNTLGTVSSPAEMIMEGSNAQRIRQLAVDDATIRFCHYFDYDNYEDQTNRFYNWIGDGHHFQPKNVSNLKYKNIARRQFAEYYRLVGKKFLKLN
jgi:hypothetical protein